MNQLDILYKNALKEILENGFEQEDKRLFHKEQPKEKSYTKAIPGMKIQVDLDKEGFPLLSLRKLPVKLFVSETVWFLTGQNTTEEFLNQYTKIWEAFKEDDGTVTSYGNRWRKHFGRDQLIGIIEMLKKDPSSRHGVAITWDPSTDSLSNGIKRKNVPCNLSVVFNIINGKLHMHSIWRSVDMILGFPHDIAGNALLAYIIAAHLGVEVGTYTHYMVNAHLYSIHYDIAKELIARETEQKKVIIAPKADWFERGSKGDHEVVTEINEQINSQYKPADPIKNIKIVV